MNGFRHRNSKLPPEALLPHDRPGAKPMVFDYPDDRSLALELKLKQYYDYVTLCPTHGYDADGNPRLSTHRFAADDSCVLCVGESNRQARAGKPISRGEAVDAGEIGYYPGEKYCKGGNHPLYKHIVTGKCITCEAARSPRQQAITNGAKYYKPSQPCTVCNVRAMRDVATDECSRCKPNTNAYRERARRQGHNYYQAPGRCGGCGKRAMRSVLTDECQRCKKMQNMTTRECARKAGEYEYIPLEPCSICDEIRPRRTSTGKCACEYNKNLIPRRGPNYTQNAPAIPRATAHALGFKRYMSNIPCKHNHDSARYVSTGGCIQCLREGCPADYAGGKSDPTDAPLTWHEMPEVTLPPRGPNQRD